MRNSKPFLNPIESRIRRDGTIERGGSALERLVRGERIVLSRALCHFELIQNPPGGASGRGAKAAALAARLRTPFDDPQFHLEPRIDMIGVWSWQKSSVSSVRSADVSIVPETLTREPSDGASLEPCTDGFEGIVWRNREIIANRWWPSEPTNRQWAQFVRSVPEFSDPYEQTAITAPTGNSWTVSDVSALLGQIRARDALAAFVLLIVTPFMFLGAQFLINAVSISEHDAALAEIQTASAEVIRARTEYSEHATALTAYNGLLSQPHPIEALTVFAETAQGFDAELMSFQTDGESLQIVLRADPSLPLADLVSGLENNATLANVVLEPTNRSGDWRIVADVEDDSDVD